MNNRTPLTHEVANQIGGAIAELRELSTHTVLTATNDARKAGLEKFLQNTVPQYADEFLACWFAVRNEYEPLIGCVAALLSRSNAIISRSQQAQQSAPAEAPSNVIQLDRSAKS
jgi:hypothetical protein